jgi:hypothetical protein
MPLTVHGDRSAIPRKGQGSARKGRGQQRPRCPAHLARDRDRVRVAGRETRARPGVASGAGEAEKGTPIGAVLNRSKNGFAARIIKSVRGDQSLSWLEEIYSNACRPNLTANVTITAPMLKMGRISARKRIDSGKANLSQRRADRRRVDLV